MPTAAPEVLVENCGPIDHLEFKFQNYGITVLRGQNGVGKSILLDAVQTAARGKGKIPLRDHAKRGKVHAFGATISIAGTTRHTGAFEVEHLEGRFDLSALVDPQLKSPESADAARIKSLVSLMGVKADPELFRKEADSFPGFDTVVDPESLKTDDLVEMARRIKADYDRKARELEGAAEREEGHAAGMTPPEDLDLTVESDPEKLQAQLVQALERRSNLSNARSSGLQRVEEATQAKQQLDACPEIDLDEMTKKAQTLKEEVDAYRKTIAQMERQLEQAKANLALEEQKLQVHVDAVRVARERESEREQWRKTIQAGMDIEFPSELAVEEAEQQVKVAQAAVDRGSLVRQALRVQHDANACRKRAAEAREQAQRFRDAGRSTDDILSSVIQCDALRIESTDGKARLVCDTDRGKGVPFHDLSEGERWKRAVDLGADRVGENGLLVIPQAAYEGLDARNRRLVHNHAIERKVYILTAEASQDPAAERGIVPTPYESN